jgi:CRISPR-associated protein (TIGR03986 family)
MSPTHTNPTRPRRDRQGNVVWARAPYNFVPLPQTMVPAQEPLPAQDRYEPGTLTGWFECELETCSPTYVRGMLTPEQNLRIGDKAPDRMTPAEKEERAPFFGSGPRQVEGRPTPAIPGSSLRGMLRQLVEVAGYGRMRWVGKEPSFTFRAVAASNDDPLRGPYQDVLGRFGANVRAGYLQRKGDAWWVVPAKTPDSLGLPERSAYLKVKERDIPERAVKGLIRLNSPEYKPQLHVVRFNAVGRSGSKGSYVAITDIGGPGEKYSHEGVLVCSGNMVESGRAGQRTPRKNHALVLAPDLKARPVRISSQAVEDYLAGLTPFQKEELAMWGGEKGCLKENAPVFYVTEGTEVAYFGHSPNFRIPARLHGGRRAARPPDFVPDDPRGVQLRSDPRGVQLRSDPRPDLADALFGWVEEKESGPKKPEPPKSGAAPTPDAAGRERPGACGGRVFVESATFEGSSGGVWLRSTPIAPRVLAGPKPTTFQHYLVQDRQRRHDPDDKASLAHYGTSPDETRLRGHKLYWHKGTTPAIEATAREREHETQLTRILPVKPGVRFRFRVRFENLRPEELGALCWALSLPGEAGKSYRHKVGMGKPIGMGSVAIRPSLVLTDRAERYGRLLEGAEWCEATAAADMAPLVEAFERYVLAGSGEQSRSGRLADVERIRMLLAMLEWREGTPEWLDQTRYMEIEYGPDKVNEYKERPVLPDPLAVAGGRVPAAAAPAGGGPGTTAAPTGPVEPAGRQQGAGSGSPPKLLTGVVDQFDEARGYGWIVSDGGGKIFVHWSGIAGGGRRSLSKGQQVTFRVVQGQKGPEAKDVRAV